MAALAMHRVPPDLHAEVAENADSWPLQVAQAGRIVMLSFHQPSPAMYELLDRVFLMARGHMVYSGEPAAAYGHFERAGLPCPGHTAVAEHMLQAVSDPAMLQTLMAHVERHGPYAGVAAVRAPPCAAGTRNTCDP